MVRTFGGFVAIGVLVSLLVTVTLVSALQHGNTKTPSPLRTFAFFRRPSASVLASVIRHPRRVLVVAAVLGALGLLLSPQSGVETSLAKLASGDVKEVRDLDTLERESGVDRGVNVVVSGPDLTAPGVIGWMVAYQEKVLKRHGYTEEKPCPNADLCPSVPLADLFGSGRGRSRAQTRALLRRLPRYFTQGVISDDRRTANISFLIRHMPIDRQKDVIDDMRRQLHPPAGVSAKLAGRTVLAAGSADLGANGRRLAFLSLLGGVVVLMIVAVARPVREAAVATIAIAAGSALGIMGLGVVNPMSVTLGALAAGLGGYVVIVLSGLYRAGRTAGTSPAAAVTGAYGQAGALLASTAIIVAGFGILVVSDVKMLREFGAIAILDLTVVLVGLILVLPAALVWSEQRGKARLPRFSALRALPRQARR
jgi:predicted RND superfamily exporter protein